MKKILSLIKVSLNHDMNLFKINTKNNNKFSNKMIPIILAIFFMFIFGIYSDRIIKQLIPIHLEIVLLSLFIIFVSIFTFIEGIYKSGSLLFNCKDDDLLFSLPIKKSTVLFIRIFKFYIFELLYTSLFFLPAIIVYALYMIPSWTYYLSSFIALLLIPIIPVALSCIIGFFITFLSSKFQGKKIFQTIFTTIFIVVVMGLSKYIDIFIANISEKATSINDFITRLYYPAGAYIKLVTDFSIKELILFILIHFIIVVLMIALLGKIYFKINSSNKKVLKKRKYTKKYIIKTNTPMKSMIKKEINRFFNTPVFIINAGFGLVLFIIICIMASLKFDDFVSKIFVTNMSFNIEKINELLPIFMFGLLCFTSFMTSITSSMISLEGKSFNILKSLPIDSYKIICAKILSALIIMLPCIIFGDLIIFIRFRFDLISIILTIIASILLPIVSETIGIIVNLKYPKMDATNDTEVVKQSVSSMLSVFIGMLLIGITFFGLFFCVTSNISIKAILPIFISVYIIICCILLIILRKQCDKLFNDIIV